MPCRTCGGTGIIGVECTPREDSLPCGSCNGRGWKPEPAASLALIRAAVAIGIEPFAKDAATMRRCVPDWVLAFYNRLFLELGVKHQGTELLSGDPISLMRPLVVLDDTTLPCFVRACAWVHEVHTDVGENAEMVCRMDAFVAATRMTGMSVADRLTMCGDRVRSVRTPAR